MTNIHFVEIENFKTFGKKVHIDLGHPAVLIGPNNSGKTSVIQAISLWSRGIKAWYEKRGDPQKKEARERIAAGINRLNILDVPVEEIRFFWNGTHPLKGRTRVEISINLGIEHNGTVKNCRLIFTYRDSEVIYCKPCSQTVKDDELLKYAASMDFHLLYPMSGIMSNVSADTEETPLPDGRISLLLGQGQTAQVLRNICYKVAEQDKQFNTGGWNTITGLMQRIFLVNLNKPVFNETRGSLSLTYREKGMKTDLDISLAGRGLQQILLILAYIYWHKSSILMIDEPDAHLEILRQKQIYAILNTTVRENHGQVIIVTHSEAILDEAVETNLTLLLQGEAVDIAKQQDIKNSLRTFGIEHYYKAKVHPRILYIEGSTDREILSALALRINHEKAKNIFWGRVNVYYTKNIEPENTLDNKLERLGGAFGNYLSHFNSLKEFVPGLRAVALFDSDNQARQDSIESNLAVLYWKDYEIENTFITPDVLRNFALDIFDNDEGPLFEEMASLNTKNFTETINEILLEKIFYGDADQLAEYLKASARLKRTLLKSQKMSQFAESVFKRYSEKYNQPVLLTKGEFYRLVPYCPVDEIPKEVHEKLDLLAGYLDYSVE